MPVTQGQGNPNWSGEETILALDLYLRSSKQILSRNSEEVIELSSYLRSMPFHPDAKKNEKYRNSHGVGMKLQNLHGAATGKGLSASKTDRAIVGEFLEKPELVAKLAAQIREQIGEAKTEGVTSDTDDLNEEFFEGRIVYKMHRTRERKPGIRKKLLKHRQENLHCDLCLRSWDHLPEDLRKSVFEVHHIKPLHMSESKKTKLSDVALLCACCHRVMHKLINRKKSWISISEALQILKAESS